MSSKKFSLALLLAAAMIMATGYLAEAEDGDFGGSYDSYSPPDVGTMIDLQPDISTFDAGAAPNFDSQITPSLPDYSYGTISSSYYNPNLPSYNPNLPSAITTTQEHILPEPAFNYGNEAIVGSMITNSPDSGPYFVTKPLSMTDFSPGEFKKTATEFSPGEFKETATEFDTRNLGHNSIIQPNLSELMNNASKGEVLEFEPTSVTVDKGFDLEKLKNLGPDSIVQPIENRHIEQFPEEEVSKNKIPLIPEDTRYIESIGLKPPKKLDSAKDIVQSITDTDYEKLKDIMQDAIKLATERLQDVNANILDNVKSTNERIGRIERTLGTAEMELEMRKGKGPHDRLGQWFGLIESRAISDVTLKVLLDYMIEERKFRDVTLQPFIDHMQRGKK